MLVLMRKVGQSVIFDDVIRLQVVAVEGRRVKIGIDAPSEVSVVRQELPGPAPGEAPEGARKPRAPVLIVEDNPDSRESLRMLMSLWGYVSYAAADGQEGVETGLQVRPSVAVLDIGLPRLDGYEVARRLRGALGKGVLLIALTGYGQPEDRRRAYEAGFDIHLTKPVDLEELHRLLER